MTNTNSFEVTVTNVSVATTDASASCTAANLAIGSFAGQFTIPANSSAVTDFTVSLIASATDACQGAKFPLTYTVTAEQT